jgi:hypothetical protein
MKNVTISEPVAKYLAAILLDPSQLHASGSMAEYARNEVAAAVFGTAAPFLDPSDARSLVFEAMRETVWA